MCMKNKLLNKNVRLDDGVLYQSEAGNSKGPRSRLTEEFADCKKSKAAVVTPANVKPSKFPWGRKTALKTLNTYILIALAGLLSTCSVAIAGPRAQNPPAAQAARATGDVTQIQPGHMTVHTEKGDVKVDLPDGVRILRFPPVSKDPASATPITASDISSGDRVGVLGHLEDDQQTIQATRIVVMTKSDLTSFHAAEVREWQTRGIEGVVKAVDADKQEITIAAPNHPPTPGNMTHNSE